MFKQKFDVETSTENIENKLLSGKDWYFTHLNRNLLFEEKVNLTQE